MGHQATEIVNLAGTAAAAARAQLATLANDPKTNALAGQSVDVEAWLDRCQVYAWNRKGERRLLFALQRAEPGVVVFCAALGGDGRAPIATEFLDHFEPLMRGLVVRIETIRRGLVRVLEARGYSSSSSSSSRPPLFTVSKLC